MKIAWRCVDPTAGGGVALCSTLREQLEPLADYQPL
jgi:hypothetical protein